MKTVSVPLDSKNLSSILTGYGRWKSSGFYVEYTPVYCNPEELYNLIKDETIYGTGLGLRWHILDISPSCGINVGRGSLCHFTAWLDKLTLEPPQDKICKTCQKIYNKKVAVHESKTY